MHSASGKTDDKRHYWQDPEMKAPVFCRKGYLITVFCLLLFTANGAAAGEPLRIILDTDISSDADDVGAVAVLHALAAQGNIEILAMMVSSGDPYSVSCLSALNSYFGQSGNTHWQSFRAKCQT